MSHNNEHYSTMYPELTDKSKYAYMSDYDTNALHYVHLLHNFEIALSDNRCTCEL